MTQKTTVVVVVEVAETYSGAEHWEELARGGLSATRRHLEAAFEVPRKHLVDCYGLQVAGTNVGTRMMRFCVRLQEEAQSPVLRRSGKGGWFVRPWFRSDEERSVYGVVWMSGGLEEVGSV